MISFSNLSRRLGVITLAAALAACGDSVPAPPVAAGSAAKAGLHAHDCRSPNAQTTQKGCKPLGYLVGGP